MYVLNSSTGLCDIVAEPTPAPTMAPAPTTPAPTEPPGLCTRSVDSLMRSLVLASDTDRICCSTHADIAEHYVSGSSGPLDVVFARLARHLVAATANVRRGVSASGSLLSHLSQASALLESSCTNGFVDDATKPVSYTHLTLPTTPYV